MVVKNKPEHISLWYTIHTNYAFDHIIQILRNKVLIVQSILGPVLTLTRYTDSATSLPLLMRNTDIPFQM